MSATDRAGGGVRAQTTGAFGGSGAASGSGESKASEAPVRMSRGLVGLLAIACGATVANMYYAQPLLHTLGRAFHTSTGTTGLLVTAGQVGYVFGLALLVPLGDLVERRNLITSMMLVTAVFQGLAAVAPDFAVYALAALVVGVTIFVAQVIVPMSAHLAAEGERGRVVGMVMSGLLIGILLSRTASGLIAQAFGWRAVFGFAAVAMLVLSAVLRRKLPRVQPTSDLGYGAALRSVLVLVRRERVLRQRMLVGGCAMGCFSLLWTSVSFLLSGEHGSRYHYGTAAIGLFGLAGVAGAASAQVAGRLADSGHNRLVTGAALLITALSFGVLYLGAHSVVVLVVGIMAMDLGVQATQISNQAAIYRLDPDARSRLTTAYMTAYFTGGVVLSSVAGALYAAGGWGAVCLLGAATGGAGALYWALTPGA